MENRDLLLLLPQRYEFSSKSQLQARGSSAVPRCCCYRKGTNFQANHNRSPYRLLFTEVVVATAKVRIFKQITTKLKGLHGGELLLLLPQRYEFSSKSQLVDLTLLSTYCCCCYRNGKNFQANHNITVNEVRSELVVVATAKLLQKSEMRKDIVIELSYKGFG